MKLALALLASLLAVGCSSAPGAPNRGEAIPAAAPAPWTKSFSNSAVLVAAQITIEGPDDLVEHVAARQADGVAYQARTTERGLIEAYHVQGQKYAEAQLDAWEIVATQRLTILRRPDLAGEVRVEAVGDVYWSDTGTERELREDQRVWVGRRGR